MGSSLDDSELSEQQLPPGYYGVGDDAFVNSNTLLTPWSGHHLTIYQDSFNYHLSAMRQCIERAFGIYMRRCKLVHLFPLITSVTQFKTSFV
jgi:hypothetical protein